MNCSAIGSRKRKKEMEEKLSYQQIMEQLDAVVRRIEEPDLPLVEVEPLIGQAKALIEQARRMLQGYRTGFEKALEGNGDEK